MSTAMAMAFERAGVVQDDPAARLREAARLAVTASPRNWDGAKDAFFKVVRNDAALLWALLEPYRAQAAQRILAEVSSELHRANAPAPTPLAAPMIQRPELRAVAKAAATVATLTRLDTVKLNGQSIGDLTSTEALEWADKHELKARFVRLLTANLPPDLPIRQFRTAEDAEAIYAQAEAGNNE